MYPAAAPIRSPRGSALCHACGLLACRPVRVLRFADPERRHGRYARLCESCFTQVFLLERSAACAAIRGQPASRRAWYRYVGPILFDQVREGLPEPTDLPELVRWPRAEHGLPWPHCGWALKVRGGREGAARDLCAAERQAWQEVSRSVGGGGGVPGRPS